MKYLISIITLILTIQCHSLSQGFKLNGPYGGEVYSMAQNPVSNYILMSTNKGIYRLGPNESTWNYLPSNLSIDSNEIIDLINADTNFYVITSNGKLFKSINDGDSWNPIFIDTTYSSAFNRIIAAKDSILIFGNVTNLYISTNFGNTLIDITNNIPFPTNYFQSALIDSGRIFLIAKNQPASANTIIYSDDNGNTWQASITNIPSQYTSPFYRLRKFNNKLYALAVSKIFSSDDNGLNWQIVNYPNIPSNSGATDIYKSNDTILIGTDIKGMYCSYDNGTSFNKILDGFPNSNINTHQFFMSNSGEIYSTSLQGVYKVVNKFNSWQSFNDGIDNMYFSSIINLENNLFIGTSRQGVFRSNDEGISWDKKSNGLEYFSYFNDIKEINAIGSRVLAGSFYNYYYSDDYCVSWLSNNSLGDINKIIVDKGDVFLGSSGGLLKSSDSGNSWTQLANWNNICSIYALDVNDNLILCVERCSGPPTTFYRYRISLNRGGSFVLKPNYSFKDIEILDSLVFGIDLNGNLLKSNNYGIFWLKDPSFPDSLLTNIYVYKSNYIFIGTQSGNIYKSINRGSSWTNMTGDFTGIPTDFLIYNSNLYVTTESNGVWKFDALDIDPIDSSSNNNIILYPNPSSDIINIVLNNLKDSYLKIELYDTLGKLIKVVYDDNTVSNSIQTTIDISKLETGIYYLNFSNSEIETTKFIKY